MVIAAATGAFVAGFLIGLFTFRIKSRWCPECGATTTSTESRQVASSRVVYGGFVDVLTDMTYEM
jgi:hypothetical protein